MTYDEWKKARVEAVAESLRQAVGANLYIIAETCVKAVAAVPLPSEEELHVKVQTAIVVAYARYDKGTFSWAEHAATAALEAIRPWIATMIEKGKGV